MVNHIPNLHDVTQSSMTVTVMNYELINISRLKGNIKFLAYCPSMVGNEF